ncbi:MAG: lamin tail domain-containing protein [Patescibacteria group bacterium]
MKKQEGLLKEAGKVILILLLAVAGFFYFRENCWAVGVGDVVINELMWSGSSLSSSDEFIELKNTTNREINLAGWQITKLSSGAETLILSIPEDKSISPGSYFLISNYNLDNINSILNIEPSLVDTAVSLVNTKLQIRLYDGDRESGANLIDAADDGIGNPIAGDTGDIKKSMERNSVPGDGTLVGNWHTCLQAVNFDHGANDCGTPKAPNSENQGEPQEPETSPPPSPSQGEGEEEREEVVEPQDQDVVVINKLGDVVINEFVSDPADEEVEWIELYNATSKEIDLASWTVEEGSGAKTNLAGILAGSGKEKFFIIAKPKGNLNNSGDIIILRTGNGVLIDQMAYGNWDDGDSANNAPAASDPNSLARKFDGQNSFNNLNDFAVTTTQTKGASNIITGLVDEEENKISAAEKILYDFSDSIIISEILPNPVGSDNEVEFIELYNKGDKEVNLLGWGLGDDSKTKFKFKDKVFIKGREYLAILRSESKIALNNGGDSVKLFLPLKDEPYKEVKYKAAEEGWGYNYATSSESWLWSEIITPGEANIIKTVNHPPVISFSCPKEIVVGQPILFDSSDTIDEDGDKLKFSWDFGDGINLTLASPEHTYLKVGDYVVKLAVSDGENEASKEEIVKVFSSAGITGDISGPASVIINEILPDPEGADAEGEWIELKNTGSGKVNLLNWQLDDGEAGSSPYKISSDLWLEPGNFYLAERSESGLALNNSNESVRLFNNSGKLADEISYEKSYSGESYAQAETGKWFWTTALTPGQENIISVAGSKSNALENVLGVKVKFPAAGTYVPVTLEKIRESESGDLVRVEGTVAVLPGILGAQYFYIVGSPGVQVYNYNKDFPGLKVGDYIEVSGEISISNGEKRIKTNGKEDMKIIENRSAPIPEELAVEKITDDYLGNLVAVTGEITDKKGSTIYLDDGTEEIKVYIKEATGIKTGEIQEGETLAIAGLLSRTESGLRIMPRSPDDIIKKDSESQGSSGQVLGEVAASDEWSIAARDKKLQLFRYLLVLAGGAIVVLGGLLVKKLRENKNR